MTDQTPSLDDFRQSYETDNNAWWRLECGHHMNLFDAALERLDAMQELARDRKDDLVIAQARVDELEDWQRNTLARIGRVMTVDRTVRLRRDIPQDGDVAKAVDAVLDERDMLRARVAELEAAQRPPLGYMPVEDSPEPKSPTGRWIVPMSVVYPTAEECLPHLKLYEQLDGGAPPDGSRHFIAEVREVQP